MTQNVELSIESEAKLENVHHDLYILVCEVNKVFPLRVLVGYRNEDDQNAAYAAGNSKLQYPNSKHNSMPAQAVDLSPLKYDPTNWKQLYYFAGIVMGIASKLGIKIRAGADFNQDLDPSTDSFHDLFHFELI